MTDRLYYNDSFLYDFDAEIREITDSPRRALILDRSAFYPTSGGQIHDIGTIHVGADAASPEPSHVGADAFVRPASEASVSSSRTLKITEVADTEDGEVVHYFEAERDFDKATLKPGAHIHAKIDSFRRRDHMQQHSGQHVLSAAFIRLHDMHTVSFHMADDYCSIDLDTPTLSKPQVESAERLANEIILENHPVEIRFVTREEAGKLGLRKVPATERDELRIIDIRDVDVSACGGTHVNQTGQIGCILLRKFEKVRQGWRVEFVAGQRAVATARKDYVALTEAAGLFSAHIYDVPQQARKSLDEIRTLRKQGEQSLEELASAQATSMLAETSESNGRKLVVRMFADREMNFLKPLAQRLTRSAPNVIALLASTSPQPSLVFAQSAGQRFDMSALLKQAMTTLGGRGGGSKDLAQGGFTNVEGIEGALKQVAAVIQG